MVYELKDYASNIARCSLRTLQTRIDNLQLPSNHIVYKGKHGQRTVIEIIHGSEHCRACGNVHHAAIEYQEHCKSFDIDHNRQLAAKLCIKWDINTVKFFKMMGVK
jgi:hypothetical protein